MSVNAFKPGLIAALLCVAGCAGVGSIGTASADGAGPAPTPRANVWSRSMEAKRIALEKGAGDSGIAVLRTDDNRLQVNVPSEFSFDPERADIKPGMRPVLPSSTPIAHFGRFPRRGVNGINKLEMWGRIFCSGTFYKQ